MESLETMMIMEKMEAAEARRQLAEEATKDAAMKSGLIEQLIDAIHSNRPSSLHHLLAMIKRSDNVQEFRVLVHEFLPEFEIAIMGQREDDAKMSRFNYFFRQKYFELDEVDEMERMLYMIPVSPHGLIEDQYQEFIDATSPHYNKIRALLSYLVEYPWEYNGEGEGHREAMYDFILQEQLAGQTDLDRVPEKGWTSEQIARALKDATDPHSRQFKAFVKWVSHDTGLWVLDCEDDSELEPAEWNRDTVEFNTELFHQADALEKEIASLEKWMLDDPAGNFGRLVDALSKIPRRRPKVKQKTLFEVLKAKQISEAAIAMESLGEV